MLFFGRDETFGEMGSGMEDLYDEGFCVNNEMFFRNREASELVAFLDGESPRATGAKNSSRFQFSCVSASRASSIVLDRTSAAGIRTDLGIILGIVDDVRSSLSLLRTSSVSVGNGTSVMMFAGGADDEIGRQE